MSRAGLLLVLVTLGSSACTPICGDFGPEVVEPVRVGDHALRSLERVEAGFALEHASGVVVRVGPTKDEVVLEYVKDGELVRDTWTVTSVR